MNDADIAQLRMHILGLLGSSSPKQGQERGAANLAHAILSELEVGDRTSREIAAEFAGVQPALFSGGVG